ncbi:lonely Cys domain-containing protein, partial [Streptomyces sp. SID3212]|uniref:lonely Cys domain-containing protein n=1 Tax=Streptomyces sp. SID3212 TaxID=2690259 RepID=UPI001F258738
MAGPSVARQGRNWTGKPVSRVRPDRLRVIETRPGVPAKIVSEADAPWPDSAYVVAADGDPGGLRVSDGRVLDTDTLAEVLLADPELAPLPETVPLLLAVPFAQRSLDLQRLANRLGRPVVGPSGDGRLVRDGSKNEHLPVLVDRAADQPIGVWAPFDPVATTPPFEDRQWTALDGTTFRDSDVDTRPLVSAGHRKRFGQISVRGGHLREFEHRFTSYVDMRRLVHKIPAGADHQDGETEELTPEPAVYVYAAHGSPGRMTLALRDGRTVWLGKQDASRYVAGLPEVRQLPPGHRLHLEICWSASDGDPRRQQPAHGPAPHVDDPWGDVPFGQYAANASRLETTSATRQTGMTSKDRVLIAGADGERGRRVTFPPEPLERELDGLARDAGLHTDPGPVPPETRATTLRLVRGLRSLFGNSVETDRGVPGGRYGRLLGGIGALETMRANDPSLSGVTPLREDMVTFYAQQHSGGIADTAAFEALLDFARARVLANPGAQLSTEIPAPALTVTLNELRTSGEALLRTVQSLPSAAAATPGQVASTLWAMVRTGKTLFNEIPPADRKAHARSVLHLNTTDTWDLPKQISLWALTAKALTEGLDVTDPSLLAAYHLTQTGAFGPAALLWQGDSVQGVYWSDIPAPAGINWRSVDRTTRGPDGTTTVEQVVPEWAGPGKPDPLLNLVDVDRAGNIVLHLPGRPALPVSDDEFLALLDLDPRLRTTPLATPVLFLTSGPGTLRPELVQRFAQRTGRPAFSYSAPLTLTATDPSAPLTIVAALDPATQAPGRWTKATRQPANGSGQSTTPSGSISILGPSDPPDQPDPLLAAETLMAGPSGARQGRNWTGRPVTRVRPGKVRLYEVRPGRTPLIVSEEDAPWPDSAYVVAGQGENGGVRVPDGRVLDAEALAEVLAADPELSALPQDVPVVLAVPDMGRGYLDGVARRLGRKVWAPSGEGRPIPDGTGDGHVLGLVDRDADLPYGAWVPFDPTPRTAAPYEDREWTALDGTTFRDSDVYTRPLVSKDHERYGMISVPDRDALRRREQRFKTFREMRRLVHLVPAGGDRHHGESEEVTPDPAIYVFAGHGKPGLLALTLRDGRIVRLGKLDGARYVAGLREVRELPPGHRLHAEVCWSASDGDPTRPPLDTAPAPHVDDPLEDIPFGHVLANESHLETSAATRSTGLNDDARVLLDGAGGERGRRVTFRFDPSDPQLDQLARDMDLHQGPGEVPPETRATTLRLVRALRTTLGNRFEDNPFRYRQALKGIGALETMRANDPELRNRTPIRLDMLDFLTRAYTGKPPDAAGHLALLAFARQQIAADPRAELSKAIDSRALRLALGQFSTSAEAVVRAVKALPGRTPVRPQDVASALWATVRAAQRIGQVPGPDREAFGRKVLHLPATGTWDRAAQQTLWELTAKAIAEGTDVTDPDLLAAYHLTQTGAFAPAGLLRQGQNVQGVNWSGTPAPAGVDRGGVRRMTLGPSGTSVQQTVPDWAAPGRPTPLLNLIHVDQAGNIVLHLPGRPPLPVSDNEFLALLDLDPALRTTPLATPVLFLTSGPGALRPELVQRFADRTGRPAFGYSAPLMLTATDPSAPLTVLALLDPATKTPGRWTEATRRPPSAAPPPASADADIFAPTDAAPQPVDPLLSERTLMAGPSGPAHGRNWTGKPVGRVRPDRVRVVETRPGVLAKIVSEEDAPWPDSAYVVAADGDSDGVRVPDGRVLDTEALADVLLADPELARLPKNVPLLLAVPFAQRSLDLQSLATRLDRRVIGPSGEGRLVRDGSRNEHLPVLVDRDAKKAFGLWVPFDPLPTTPPSENREWTSLEGITFRDSDVDTRPLVSEDHERFGQISMRDGESLRRSEQRFTSYLYMRRILHKVPAGAGLQDGEIEEITPDPAVYVFAAHAKPGRMALALRDGRTVRLAKQDASRYLAGLPEIRRLPPGHRLGLEICWSGADGDPRHNHPSTLPVPHVDDPWGDVPFGQYAANASRLETDAVTTQTGMDGARRLIVAPADGEKGRRVRFPPEPLEHELDGLARDAGLHAGPGPVPPETRATMLRLVRGLRRLFGNGVEQDRGVPGERYERLVKGIGALETMRANDPALSGVTPLREDMVTFYAQEHSDGIADPAAFEALLDFARERVLADPDARLSTEIPAPALKVTLAELATSGETLLRSVQSLPSAAAATPGQVASTLWAMVRAGKMLFHDIPPADREAHGRGVLHLTDADPWDLPKQKKIWALTAKALAEGHDVTDRDVLAAHHLRGFAFVKVILLRQGQVIQGVNWSDRPAPAGIDWRSVDRTTPGPDGTTVEQVVPEWAGPDMPAPVLVLIHVNQAGNVVLHLPGGPPIEVSDDEFLELLRLDPALRSTALGTPALFLTSGPGALRPELVQRFAQRTGRPAFGYSAPLGLTAPDPSAPLTIVAALDPATQAPGEWIRADRRTTGPSGEFTASSGPATIFGLSDPTEPVEPVEPVE